MKDFFKQQRNILGLLAYGLVFLFFAMFLACLAAPVPDPVTTSAQVVAAAASDPMSSGNLVKQVILSLISSLIGGGVFAIIFRSEVDKSLKNSDTLKILVLEMISNHPLIKDMKDDIHDLDATLQSTNSAINSLNNKASEVQGGVNSLISMMKKGEK